MSGELTGKVAIVTGSGQGLGRAYAEAMAAAGASVVINDVNQATADDAVAAITAAGGKAIAVVAPVGPTETADALIAAAKAEFGRIDIVVANAGVLRDKVLWKMEDSDFDLVIQTHLRGTFTVARAAAVAMREQGEGGRIIVIGSPAGQHGNFGQTNYSAAKAGLIAMARTMSMELARANITVNAVIPTAMTAMTATIPMYAEIAKAYDAGEELPKKARQEHALGSPANVASLIVWLSSDDSASVTGQAIAIGGDRLALYSHPEIAAFEYHDGGWSVEDISRAWPEKFAAHQQTSGVSMPPLD